MHITLLAALSVDGFIGHSREEKANWTSAEDKAFFVAETKKWGAVVMGAKTYATIGRPLSGRLIFVLTTDPNFKEVPGEVERFSGELSDLVSLVEQRGFKGLVVAGGERVYSAFLRAGLVNELAITIEPVIFGRGLKLAELDRDVVLGAPSVEQLGTKAVLMRYKVSK